jgi:hypothetical protein
VTADDERVPARWGQARWYRGIAVISSSRGTPARRRHHGPQGEDPPRVHVRARPGRPARTRPRGARLLAGQPGLRAHPVPGWPRVGVLRGSTDRERHARRPSHRGPRVQGRVSAPSHDEGLPRRTQGGVGLPRPARRARRRAGARLLRQARHRGVRHRRVQPAMSGVGWAAYGRVRRTDPPHGLLGRPGRRVLDDGPAVHRVGVVVAQADLRAGTAGRGLPGRAVVSPVRNRTVRSRAGPRLWTRPSSYASR